MLSDRNRLWMLWNCPKVSNADYMLIWFFLIHNNYIVAKYLLLQLDVWFILYLYLILYFVFVYILSPTSNPRTTNDGENDWSTNTSKNINLFILVNRFLNFLCTILRSQLPLYGICFPYRNCTQSPESNFRNMIFTNSFCIHNYKYNYWWHVVDQLWHCGIVGNNINSE